jgi:copper resistance protein B
MALILTLGVGTRAQSPVSLSVADPHTGHTMRKPGDQSKPAGPPSHDDQHHQEPTASPAELPPFIPRLTDADRQAAFPDLEGHAVHDRAIHSFVLLDQLEWQSSDREAGFALDSKGWIGRDRDRLWFRAEGDGGDGRVDEAQVHMLYGRQVSRWWDVVGGIRQDFRPGPAQSWAAIGIQGLAPYRFEIEATGYIGAAGRTHAKFEVEYELLLTNRLIAQPLAEIALFGKSDPERGLGAGLSTTDIGVRLRYEVKPELAPYAGVVWRNKWGKTADLAEGAGAETRGAGLVTGLRLWF